MKILAIVGKVDSRVIAYPLARALGLSGLTAIISDDGAYRRLFFGDELQGTVTGVDVSVGVKADGDLKNSLNESGINYDNMIVVTSGYIPDDITGVIVCKGVDKSMMAKDDETRGEEVSKKKKDKKQEDKKESGEETDKKEKVVEEKKVKEVKKDEIHIPDGIPFKEVYISFDTPPKDGTTAIHLKDTAMRYIYSCEERKELLLLDDKTLVKTIVRLAAEPLGIPENELYNLMMRKEYITGKK